MPDWVLDAMVPQLEKIYEETKLAKRNLRKEKKEKAKIEPEEGFFPTEQRRPNIGEWRRRRKAKRTRKSF